jgi:PAS domain S-box-containing protein
MEHAKVDATARQPGRVRLVVNVAATAAGVIGVLVLFGWAAGIDALKTVFPGLASMKPNSAVAFLAAAIALGPASRDGRSRTTSFFACGAALVVALLGTLTLAEYVLGVDPGIDELLFRDPASAAVSLPPGRMSSANAFGFLLLGSALLALHAGRSASLVRRLCVPAFFIHLLALAGYLFGVQALYGVGPYSSMSIHSAVTGILLSVGLIAASEIRGAPGLIGADDTTGILVRRLLAAACIVPLVLGSAIACGVRAGLYRDAFALALFGIVMIVVLFGGTLFGALKLRRMDEVRRAAEQRLRAGESIYQAVGESIDYGIWVCNPDGKNTYASPSFLKLVGLTQEECSEFGWGRVLHPDDAERTIAAWKECVRVRGRWDVEHRVRGCDGRWHPVLARGVPVEDERGEIKCWVGINLDISELKRAEASLRELNGTLERRVAERSAAAEERALALAVSENELRHQAIVMQSILNGMSEGVIVADGRGQIVLLNRAAQILHGRVPVSAARETWSETFDLFRPDGTASFPAEELPLARALRGESSDDVELFVRPPSNPDGVFISANGRPLRSEAGEIQGGIVVLRDVTARKLMVEKIRESEELFRTAFDFAAIGMGLVDLTGRWLRVNHSLCELVGYTEEELLATDFQSITHPGDLSVDLDNAQRLLAGEVRHYQLEKRYVHKQGHSVDVLLSGSLIRDAAGAPSFFVAQIQDLTQQKAAEERNRQALLRTRFVEQSIAAREDEQRRISRDLHDGIGQTLTSIRLGLRVLEESSVATSAQDTARELRRMVVAAQEEVRRLVKNLRPNVLDDIGLIPALKQLVDEFVASHDVVIALQAESVADDRFPAAVETAIYRIVQESLTNVAKHSGAGKAEVVLRRDSQGLALSISDDGRGFDPDATLKRTECFGVIGMRERASLLNGTFDVFRRADGGTTVRVSIPLPRGAAA